MAKHLKQAGERRNATQPTRLSRSRAWQAHTETGTVKHTTQKLGVSKDTFYRWKHRLSLDHE